MIKAVFFDLFFTLADPCPLDRSENDVLGISPDEWEAYTETPFLYQERAIGRVKTGREIIEQIAQIIPYQITEGQKQELLFLRENRMKNALLNIDGMTIKTLQALRFQGVSLGLISNADRIDIQYWELSPLSRLFDTVVFSCDVGILKPDLQIYFLAMKKLSIMPEDCLFVGDGGSDELYGAKMAGMKTGFTEYLITKPDKQRGQIMKYADYHIHGFDEILHIHDIVKDK